jgi:hypothetical protein
VVLLAIKNNPSSLEFADVELRNNLEIVIQAIMIDPYSLYYASDEIKNNKEVLEIVKNKLF